MLRGAGLRVKPGRSAAERAPGGFARSGRLVQTGAMNARRLLPLLAACCLIGGAAATILAPEWRVLRSLLLAGGLVAVVAHVVMVRRERTGILARRDAIVGVMDAADALEARLRDARGELEAVAGDHENPVRGAMQDLLRQRLWLQEHAQHASLAQLDEVRDALDQARVLLERQLGLIARARAGA